MLGKNRNEIQTATQIQIYGELAREFKLKWQEDPKMLSEILGFRGVPRLYKND